jgi:hypothetical protein
MQSATGHAESGSNLAKLGQQNRRLAAWPLEYCDTDGQGPGVTIRFIGSMVRL